MQTLLTGLGIGESPRWHQGRLWFSNWGMQEVVAVDLDGQKEVVLRVPTTLPFSIDWLLDARQEPDGTLINHADLTSHSKDPCDEIVVDGRGNIYVNGGPGIAALISPGGLVRQVPVGMAITPDNSTLIIAESHGKKLTAFDIAADGTLANRHVWADLNGGCPDSICIDAEKAVWYGDVPNKRCVRVREGGEVLQTINLGRGTTMRQHADRRDNAKIFLMAAEWHGFQKMADGFGTSQVLIVDAPAPGIGWP
jgi:sugar lactone lactonase YvrE